MWMIACFLQCVQSTTAGQNTFKLSTIFITLIASADEKQNTMFDSVFSKI